jgi:hypothetical protein
MKKCPVIGYFSGWSLFVGTYDRKEKVYLGSFLNQEGIRFEFWGSSGINQSSMTSLPMELIKHLL